METVNLKGFPVPISGELPNKGVEAEDFCYIKNNLNEFHLYDVEAKVKILVSVPSLDTTVSQKTAQQFNESVKKLDGVHTLIISKDLPFAQKRFCEAAKLENVESVSDYRYGDYGEDFGVLMTDGPLKGLLTGSVLVLDDKNMIHHSELVKDIFMEPDYDAAVSAAKKLISK